MNVSGDAREEWVVPFNIMRFTVHKSILGGVRTDNAMKIKDEEMVYIKSTSIERNRIKAPLISLLNLLLKLSKGSFLIV